MNRKTFLSTLLAIVSAPFLLKSKEKEPATNEEIAKYFKVPPTYLHNYESATFNPKGGEIAGVTFEPYSLKSKHIKLSKELEMVLNRKR